MVKRTHIGKTRCRRQTTVVLQFDDRGPDGERRQGRRGLSRHRHPRTQSTAEHRPVHTDNDIVLTGHSLQLACDVQAAQHLIWTRLGVSLHDIPQFKASLQIQNQILIQFY